MRRFVALLIPFAVVVSACGKKGLPKECEEYLVRYDCFLAKHGMAERASTIKTMRQTWKEGCKTTVGRAAITSACKQSMAQMQSKFDEDGCKGGAPAAGEDD